jgi:23S rRNA (guanine745-N1)-methyltransferase
LFTGTLCSPKLPPKRRVFVYNQRRPKEENYGRQFYLFYIYYNLIQQTKINLVSSIICPHCKNPLSDSGNKSYNCISNHSFDLSKEGYLNLLPVNQKKTKSPGDSEMMISARRNFLDLGYYSPLIEAIKSTIEEEIKFENDRYTALDAGCGEGFYSENALKSAYNGDNQVYGTDISKFAVKIAAKKYKDNFYFVSSIYNLPVAAESINLILSVFSPVHPEEFKRVLAQDGYIIIVNPGENHLKELAESIYETFRPHVNNIPSIMESSFQLINTKRVTFKIQLKDSEELLMLLKMTPYYWTASKETLEKLNNITKMEVTCDFNISVFA